MKRKLISLIFAPVFTAQVQASLLVYEGFDGGTTNGQVLSGIGNGTSTGFSSGWSTTAITVNNAGYTTGAGAGEAWTNGNLGSTYNLVSSSTAGSSVGTGNDHSRFIRSLDATAAAGVSAESANNGTIWLSFVGQRNGTTTGGVELINTTTNRFTEGFGSWNTNNWNWSDRQTAGTGNVFPMASTEQAFITVQLSYTDTNTVIRMFVNRTGNVTSLTGVPSIENVIANTSNNRPNFNALSVYGGFKIDELRVGTTYADVAPVQNVVATNAGASTWAGSSLVTAGAGTLTVTGTHDVRFGGTAATVAVDGAGVTSGTGRLEFNSGGHSLTGGNIATANISNLAGDNSILASVNARHAEIATGTTLTLASGTLSNGLYGAGNLVKTTNGVLTLNRADILNSDNNTTGQPIMQVGRSNFSGGITISQGTVEVAHTNAHGAVSSYTLGNAGSDATDTELRFLNSADTSASITVTNNGSGKAIISAATGLTLNASTISGTLTLNRDVVIRSQISDRLALEGKVTGTGNLLIDGGSRTTMSNTTNDFVGNIDVQGTGTVFQSSVVGAGEIIPNATNVNVGAGAIFKLAATGGTTETINALTGSGHTQRHEAVGGQQTLAIGSANGSGVYDGTLANGSGTLALTKLGTGTQTLNGDGTYTGPTRVQAGALIVNGNLSSSALSIEGGTVGGEGIVGATTLTSGIISPGNSPGILTTGSLTLNGGSIAMEINGSPTGMFDQINTVGTVTFNADIPLTLTLNYDPADNGTESFVLVANDGVDSISLGAFRLTLAGSQLDEGEEFMIGGQAFVISYAGDTGNDIVLTAIPEPSATLLSLVGAGFLFRRRRRQ